ncbi:MAG: hypothetical protein ABIC19_00910 [Patescibacteria group bacterium]|nr:hypothetical protein [Patescibacteria group bacterium]
MKKKINVCIIPSGDRSGQANMIHHYSKIGCNVFIPKHDTADINWATTATWPALLTRSISQPNKRNLEIHGFKRKENWMIFGKIISGNMFGEDRFIVEENNGPLYENKKIRCELVDFRKQRIKIDLFHTLRCSRGVLRKALKFSNQYFPRAAWVSSTLMPGCHEAVGRELKNICKTMPLPESYWIEYKNLNCFDCYPSGFEFDLLNVKLNRKKRQGFASFCHNYKKRYPGDFIFLKNINSRLKDKGIYIPNYGGNVWAQGADIKYNRKGFTGDLPTLSIRQAARLTAKLKAVIQFKQADYGGGVVWYALMARTPIITHRQYVKNTGGKDLIIRDRNAVIVNTEKEAAKAILKLERDRRYLEKLVNGMDKVYASLVNDKYWQNFKIFINRALDREN